MNLQGCFLVREVRLWWKWMKTNKTLVVRYKVNYDDDAKILSDKFADIVDQHAVILKETPWKKFKGDGRISINGVGIIEWKVKNK